MVEWPKTERCDLMDETQVVKIILGQMWLSVYVNRILFVCVFCLFLCASFFFDTFHSKPKLKRFFAHSTVNPPGHKNVILDSTTIFLY